MQHGWTARRRRTADSALCVAVAFAAGTTVVSTNPVLTAVAGLIVLSFIIRLAFGVGRRAAHTAIDAHIGVDDVALVAARLRRHQLTHSDGLNLTPYEAALEAVTALNRAGRLAPPHPMVGDPT